VRVSNGRETLSTGADEVEPPGVAIRAAAPKRARPVTAAAARPRVSSARREEAATAIGVTRGLAAGWGV
jgi:hypothetical protein